VVLVLLVVCLKVGGRSVKPCVFGYDGLGWGFLCVGVCVLGGVVVFFLSVCGAGVWCLVCEWRGGLGGGGVCVVCVDRTVWGVRTGGGSSALIPCEIDCVSPIVLVLRAPDAAGVVVIRIH